MQALSRAPLTRDASKCSSLAGARHKLLVVLRNGEKKDCQEAAAISCALVPASRHTVQRPAA